MKAHKCVKQLNKKLKETNTRLVGNLLNSNHIFVATEKIDNARMNKATSVVATYCPFCGKKLKGT